MPRAVLRFSAPSSRLHARGGEESEILRLLLQSFFLRMREAHGTCDGLGQGQGKGRSELRRPSILQQSARPGLPRDQLRQLRRYRLETVRFSSLPTSPHGCNDLYLTGTSFSAPLLSWRAIASTTQRGRSGSNGGTPTSN